MSKAASSLAGVSLTAVVVMIASNGEKFSAALAALWQFLIMVTTKTPAGLASFLLAWALGLLVMYSLRKWLPQGKESAMHIPIVGIEAAGSLAGLVAFWSQTPTLLGLLVAMVTGLSVPLMYRVIAGIVRGIKRRIYLTDTLP